MDLNLPKKNALEELTKEMHEQLALLKNIVKQLEHSKSLVTKQFESEIVDLFEGMLEKLVRRDLKLNREKLKEIIMQAMTMLPSSENKVHLLLSDDDFDSMTTLLSGIVDNVSVEKTLTQGDFKLMLNDSVVDGSVKSRVKNISTQMTSMSGNGDA